MGIFADILEANLERQGQLENYKYRSFGNESKEISYRIANLSTHHNGVNLGAMSAHQVSYGSGSYVDLRAELDWLVEKRESLRLRENLATFISKTNSEMTKMCLNSYQYQLSEAYSLIVKSLEKYSSITRKSKISSNKFEIKNEFVVQMITSLLKGLNNNGDVLSSNLDLIRDIKAFVVWFYDETFYGFSAEEFCDDEMLVDFLYRQLELEKELCSVCGKETIRENNKCVCCGKAR